jgi:hypothetical protein
VDDSLRKDSTVSTSRDTPIWRGGVKGGRVKAKEREFHEQRPYESKGVRFFT